jgi:(R,R)-butanediol dehydrogenase / meso-butanediol dehydrogenase / diacetyl reductase
MQWVRTAGAGQVIVIEPNKERRNLALALGATLAVAAGDEAVNAVKERTGGLGADIVFECVGRAPAIQSAADLVRRGGSICMIGLSDTPATIVPGVWLVKEIRLTSALAYTHEEFDLAMGMIADGRVKLAPLHTQTVGLADLGSALGELASGAPTQTKILVDPRLN